MKTKKVVWTKKEIKIFIRDILITYETENKEEAIKMLKFLYEAI